MVVCPDTSIRLPSLVKNVAVSSLDISALVRSVKLPLGWLSIPAPFSNASPDK